MADTKITDLTAITGANTASGDLIPIVDVSDTTMAASGTTKKITRDELELALTADGLVLPEIASPSTPAADTVLLFGRDIGGRSMLAIVGPSGLDTALQPHKGRNRVRQWLPICGSTTVPVYGCTVPTADGTATNATKATTNLHQFMDRVEYLVTAASATAVAGFRAATSTAAGLGVYRGNASNIGGFHLIVRWGPATGVTTGTRRAWVGLRVVGAATDVNPSTLTNMIGMGWDAADTNVQIMHNDGSGTATKVDCGFARASADRTSVYELDLFAVANGSTVTYTVTELVTGSTFSGTISTDLPSSTQIMAPQGYCSVGGTSSVIGIALMGMYLETDY